MVHPDGTGAPKKGRQAIDKSRRDGTRKLVLDLRFTPVVPPKTNRIAPWPYDRNLCKRRNEIERLFGRLKAFLNFALIVDMIKR